jgi:predicted lipoprotein with Yx(FWY)xxD motif
MRAVVLVVLVALATAAPAASGTVVKTAHNAKLNATILVDPNGMTLYDFTADYGGTPTCYNDSTYHCSKAWPPLLTKGLPKAGAGVKQKLLGTVRRSDGAVQVTYAKHPLYRFHGYQTTPPDKKPGDVNGQGFLSIWWVLSPGGKEDHAAP